jgi:hypothetical protein
MKAYPFIFPERRSNSKLDWKYMTFEHSMFDTDILEFNVIID